jgi:succinate dehydrogenase/fumarate reductase flavoprotein subunit
MAYHTGGSDELTGDGQAMAFRAGVDLIDMEMATFMDRYLIHPPFASRDNFVWNWASEREITNNVGEPIIKDEQVNLETLKKLELLSKEITYARNSENGTLILKNPDETLKNGYIRLKDILNQWNYENIIFEITIGCHYCSGGIRVNEKTETNLKGLYAVGEASGGLFGARRIASALTEASVQGTIAGRNSKQWCERPVVKPSGKSVKKIIERIEKPLKRRCGVSPSNLFKTLRNLSSRYLAIYRTENLLNLLIGNLEKLSVDVSENLFCSYDGRVYNKEWMDSLSLENLLLCLESSAISSLVRRETRGFHRRADYSARNDDEWLKNIVIKNFEGKPRAHVIPICRSLEV